MTCIYMYIAMEHSVTIFDKNLMVDKLVYNRK